MGVDFIRRRNDRFIRRRDEMFVAETTPDLLSACTPTTVVSVQGVAVGSVAASDALWAPEVMPTGPITLFNGDEPAVMVDGDAADHVRAERRDGDGPVFAQVTEVDTDHGLVVVRVGSCT
jgi:hypothetical protein